MKTSNIGSLLYSPSAANRSQMTWVKNRQLPHLMLDLATGKLAGCIQESNQRRHCRSTASALIGSIGNGDFRWMYFSTVWLPFGDGTDPFGCGRQSPSRRGLLLDGGSSGQLPIYRGYTRSFWTRLRAPPSWIGLWIVFRPLPTMGFLESNCWMCFSNHLGMAFRKFCAGHISTEATDFSRNIWRYWSIHTQMLHLWNIYLPKILW